MTPPCRRGKNPVAKFQVNQKRRSTKNVRANPPANRWWFEGSRWTDEILWHGADHLWHWWKEAVPRMNNDYLKFVWRNGEERAAFAYELARRSSPQALKLPTYPELTAHDQNFLKSLFGIADARWTAFSNQREHTAQCLRFWNLKEADAALVKTFKHWLSAVRSQQQVQKPKRQQPQNKKPPNWDGDINLLDKETGCAKDGTAFDADTARGRKSKALANSRKFYDILKSAVSNSNDIRLVALREFFG